MRVGKVRSGREKIGVVKQHEDEWCHVAAQLL